jgi:hypothetical protein
VALSKSTLASLPRTNSTLKIPESTESTLSVINLLDGEFDCYDDANWVEAAL